MAASRVILFALLFVLLALAAQADTPKIYWAGDDAIIRRANLDGSDAEDVVDVTSGVRGLEIDAGGGKMYWSTPASNMIRRANLSDGSAIEQIGGAFIGNARDLVLDVAAGHVYYTAPSFSRRINRVDFDGNDDRAVIFADDASPAAVPFGIDIRKGTGELFWAENGIFGIRRSDLSGSNISDVLSAGGSGMRALAIHESADFVYWSEAGSNAILRATLSGSAATTLVAGLPASPSDIEVDPVGGKIYWAITSDSLIQRANLAGTDVETIVTSEGRPKAIALFRAPDVPTLGDSGLLLLGALLLATAILFARAPGRSDTRS